MSIAASLDTYGTTGRAPRSCPAARGVIRASSDWTLTAFRPKCKRWACPDCGPRKARKLAEKLSTLPVNRFFTLTQQPRHEETCEDAFRRIARDWHALVKRLRRLYPKQRLEYARIYEVTKRGQPHIHVLANCGYIPQRTLSRLWKEISGAGIVDIRKVNSSKAVKNYLAKYLSKGGEMPDNLRRFQLSWAMARIQGGKVERLSNDRPHWEYSPISLSALSESYTNAGWVVMFDRDGGLIAADINPPADACITPNDYREWRQMCDNLVSHSILVAIEHSEECSRPNCGFREDRHMRYYAMNARRN